MTSVMVPCDLYGDESDISELRLLIYEFDDLFEKCMTGILTPEQQKTLNELYGALQLAEEEYWEGVSYEIVQILSVGIEVEFPMIRMVLGVLPGWGQKKGITK